MRALASTQVARGRRWPGQWGQPASQEPPGQSLCSWPGGGRPKQSQRTRGARDRATPSGLCLSSAGPSVEGPERAEWASGRAKGAAVPAPSLSSHEFGALPGHWHPGRHCPTRTGPPACSPPYRAETAGPGRPSLGALCHLQFLRPGGGYRLMTGKAPQVPCTKGLRAERRWGWGAGAGSRRR